jgi:hypothetical protein
VSVTTTTEAPPMTKFSDRPVPQPDYLSHPAYGGKFGHPTIGDRVRALARFTPWMGIVLAKRWLMFDRLPTLDTYNGPMSGGAAARVIAVGRYIPPIVKGLARETVRAFSGSQLPPPAPEGARVLSVLSRDGIAGVHLTADQKTKLNEQLAPYLTELRKKRAAQTKRSFEGNQRWINRHEGGALYAALDQILTQSGVMDGARGYLKRPVEIKHLTLQINDKDDSFHYNKFTDVGLKEPSTNYMHLDTSEQMLKCMIYLNEVSAQNGGFCFVPGSHRLNIGWFEGVVRRTNDRAGLSGYDPAMRRLFTALPAPLRFKCTFGADLLDSDPMTRELAQAERQFTSEDGDVFLFDNLGIHRGALISAGERLVIIANLA